MKSSDFPRLRCSRICLTISAHYESILACATWLSCTYLWCEIFVISLGQSPIYAFQSIFSGFRPLMVDCWLSSWHSHHFLCSNQCTHPKKAMPIFVSHKQPSLWAAFWFDDECKIPNVRHAVIVHPMDTISNTLHEIFILTYFNCDPNALRPTMSSIIIPDRYEFQIQNGPTCIWWRQKKLVCSGLS